MRRILLHREQISQVERKLGARLVTAGAQRYEGVWGFPGNNYWHLVSAATRGYMCLYELVCEIMSGFGVSGIRFPAPG